MPAQPARRSRVTPSSRPSPQEVAEAVRDGMFPNDRATRALGIEILAVAPGGATASMTVREDMVNGWGTCHGGLIAPLADSAFALACNSRRGCDPRGGAVTLAAGFDITFVEPGAVGDRLLAPRPARWCPGAGRGLRRAGRACC